MTQYVWCKNEECRIPVFRCILCRSDCYELRARSPQDELGGVFEVLRNSGKFKEHFVMKRKDGGKIKDGQLSFLEKEQTEQVAEPEEEKDDSGVFILENGRIEPISSDSYASSTMYRTVDSFSIDCRLVKPEEPGSMVYEGRKPSKKTIPILVGRDEKCEILDSWEVLESDPSRLANVREVLGVLPVKQVFVLKRK